MPNAFELIPGIVGHAARQVVDATLEGVVLLGYPRPGFAIRRQLFDWADAAAVDCSGRTMVVTGATGGLGLETAAQLAAQGAEVVLVGRSDERLESARDAVGQRVADAKLSVERADLSDLSAVAKLGKRLAGRHRSIDAVIHNAGALNLTRAETAQQHESTFATMVLGPQLLTHLLTKSLDAGAGRVIWVTSGGMYTTAIDLDDLESTGSYMGSKVYARAKRMQVDLMSEWADRHEGPTSFHATHPGWADTPGVQSSLPTFAKVLGPILRSPAEGVDTTVWVAGSEEAGHTTGVLWFDRRPRSLRRLPNTLTSPDDRKQLWDRVEEMVAPWR